MVPSSIALRTAGEMRIEAAVEADHQRARLVFVDHLQARLDARRRRGRSASRRRSPCRPGRSARSGRHGCRSACRSPPRRCPSAVSICVDRAHLAAIVRGESPWPPSANGVGHRHELAPAGWTPTALAWTLPMRPAPSTAKSNCHDNLISLARAVRAELAMGGVADRPAHRRSGRPQYRFGLMPSCAGSGGAGR